MINGAVVMGGRGMRKLAVGGAMLISKRHEHEDDLHERDCTLPKKALYLV